MVKYNN